ncbi:MAG TPA: YodL domain-containing protein, partial [Bacillota bacterium]|nr:YodL domain-containing protein [Bacillota bacterium]
MKIKVYQLDGKLDKNRVKFMDYDFTMKHGGINPSAYKTVFDGEVDTDNLEKIFRMFNSDERPPTHFGH